MGKRELQKEKKIALLEVIKNKKSVLFGNFKNVTAVQKQEAWEDVLLKAKSLELASSEKSWIYVRDNLFGLWKSRTLVLNNSLYLLLDYFIEQNLYSFRTSVITCAKRGLVVGASKFWMRWTL